MLTKIRDRHMKRILWAMVLTIVPVFILWSGYTSMRGRQQNRVGTIAGKPISLNTWYQYLRLAHLWTFLNAPRDQKITAKDIEAMAIDFLVLSRKAQQEKISVSDQEVVNYIRNGVFAGRQFDEESYTAFLQYLMREVHLNYSSRGFEETVRHILSVEKLIAKNTQVTVSDAEVRAAYEKDTVKAKIAYLLIPYAKFKVDVGVSESAVKEFYEKNKDQFKREEKIKLKYTIIPKDNPKLEEITKQLTAAKNITEVCNAYSLPVKETGFISINDPIEEIGWLPQVNIIAFTLKDTAVSPVLQTDKGFIVMQRLESKPAYTPALSEITDEVKQAYVMDGARRDTEAYSKELLDNITKSGQSDLKSFGKKDNVQFSETGFFGYSDYIEGMGLDEQVSAAVFSLTAKQVYSKPLFLANGAYIIQLIEKTPVDEADFAAKKNTYIERLRNQREMLARQEFIVTCLNQANVKIESLPEQNQN